MSTKVFVGNLEFRTTREELEALFSQAGTIRDIVLPTDRNTGRPRGFAFVEYESDDEAAQAIERFNGHELGGRPLRVNSAEDRPAPTGNRPSFSPGGFQGGGGNRFPGKPKGSRRNIRARKRSL
jgi:RNA recognition motif-containing protein